MLKLNTSSALRSQLPLLAKDMTLTALTALSPLDGRYAAKVESLRIHFSEYGLIRNRVRVEIAWLKALAAAREIAECPAFSDATIAKLDSVVADFSVADAEAIKAIEARTNHDVKAMEYWLKECLASNTEVMRVSDKVRRLIAQKGGEDLVREAAAGAGMISLGEDGLAKDSSIQTDIDTSRERSGIKEAIPISQVVDFSFVRKLQETRYKQYPIIKPQSHQTGLKYWSL